MLPARHRLKSKKRFDEVFRRGKTAANDVLIVKHVVSDVKDPKFGFSVGLKFSKKASQRNKARRWLREAVRPIVRRVKPGREIIFLINSKFPREQINYDLVDRKINDLLGKAKLLK